MELNSKMETINNHMLPNNELQAEQPTIELLQDVGRSMKELKDQSAKMIEARGKVTI